MHVLGHSFSQKRKHCKRPRDLNIRKVSFSGSSHSACSLSSSDSTASACTAIIRPQHASHAPPRLHERPFKTGGSHRPHLGGFYDDGADADEAVVSSDCDSDSYDDDDENLPHFQMEMPPHAGPADHTAHDRYEPTDYFAIQLAQRPPMPRSRWSESTIQSVQSVDAIPTPGSTFSTAASESEYGGEDHGPPVVVEMPPNFSYKRAVSAPGPTAMSPLEMAPGRRPPLRTMDSIDEFVKRGGWKRRGVVFNPEDGEDANDDLSL